MIDDTDNLAEPLEPETAGTEIDGDELLETEGEDNPEEETEPEDDTDEVEFEGKKYRVSKDIKDALLRQADYTRKTQELAEHRNQVSATIERLTAVSHEETQALAQVAMVAAQIKQYENIDWDAWDQVDPNAANKARWEITQLQQQQSAAIGQYQQAGEAKHSIAQQETAKRLEEADRFASTNIPGWSRETAQATLDYARTAYRLSNEELAGAIADKPEVLMLLHDAMEGRRLREKTATAKKIEAKQAIKPAASIKGATPAIRGLDDKLSAEEWIKRRNAQAQNRR